MTEADGGRSTRARVFHAARALGLGDAHAVIADEVDPAVSVGHTLRRVDRRGAGDERENDEDEDAIEMGHGGLRGTRRRAR